MAKIVELEGIEAVGAVYKVYMANEKHDGAKAFIDRNSPSNAALLAYLVKSSQRVPKPIDIKRRVEDGFEEGFQLYRRGILSRPPTQSTFRLAKTLGGINLERIKFHALNPKTNSD